MLDFFSFTIDKDYLNTTNPQNLINTLQSFLNLQSSKNLKLTFLTQENFSYPHKGFLNSQKEENKTYTLLIPLTETYREKLILWYQVEKDNKDYRTLIQKDLSEDEIYHLFRNLKIPFYNNQNMLERYNFISKSLKNLSQPYLPKYIYLEDKKCLIYPSHYLEGGEKFIFYETDINFIKIRFSIKEKDTENIIKISKNPIIDMIPFHVFIYSGEYNDKNFNYLFFRLEYESLRDTLDEICDDIKERLNSKYREWWIESKIKSEMREIDPELNEKFIGEKIDNNDLQIIKNFTDMWKEKIKDFVCDDYFKIKVVQEVENIWEERDFRRCIYPEDTTFNCEIKVYLLFLQK